MNARPAVNPRAICTAAWVEEDLRASVAQEQLLATLAGFFGAVALLLAAVGL